MNQVKSGNHAQFSVLFERYNKSVFSYFMQWTKDIAKAEDLTQDVFIKIFKNRDKFKGEHFKIWLFTISRNLRTDFYRKNLKNKINQTPVEEMFDHRINHEDLAYEPEEDELTSFDGTRLKLAIETLPEDKREVLFMQFFQGLKSNEIGEVLGISPENARARSHRAIKELRSYLLAQKNKK